MCAQKNMRRPGISLCFAMLFASHRGMMFDSNMSDKFVNNQAARSMLAAKYN